MPAAPAALVALETQYQDYLASDQHTADVARARYYQGEDSTGPTADDFFLPHDYVLLGNARGAVSTPGNFVETVNRSFTDALTYLFGPGTLEAGPNPINPQGQADNYFWHTAAPVKAAGPVTPVTRGSSFKEVAAGFWGDSALSTPAAKIAIAIATFGASAAGQALAEGAVAASTAAAVGDGAFVGAFEDLAPAAVGNVEVTAMGDWLGSFEDLAPAAFETTADPFAVKSLLNGFSPTTFGDSFVSGIAEDAGIMSGNAANYAAVSGAVPGAAGELLSSSGSWLNWLPRPSASGPVNNLFSRALDYFIPPARASNIMPTAGYGMRASTLPASSSTAALFALIAAGVVGAVLIHKHG